MNPMGVLIILFLMFFGHQAAAQYDFCQVLADVKRISASPDAGQAEVDRLNRQLKEIYTKEIHEEEDIEKLKVFKAGTLTQLITRCAEEIDEHVRQGNFTRVGIPEFTTDRDRTFDLKYGALPRSIADTLRHQLAVKAKESKSGYSVLSEDALRKTLQDQGITPSDLGTEKTKNLRVNGEIVSLLVDGHLTIFESGGIIFEAKLIRPDNGNLIAQIRHAAMLDDAELAMSGISAKFSIKTGGISQRYRLEPGVGLVTEGQSYAAARIRGAFVEPHPLASRADPNPSGNTSDGTFDVRIEIRNNPRRDYSALPPDRIAYKENVCYIGLNKGEEYRIRYKVIYPEIVFVRVMVDGLNSLSQRPTAYSRTVQNTRGAYVEAVESDESDATDEFILAPRVPLDKARPWVVDVLNDPRDHFVEGFVDANRQRETMRRFKIVDLDESAAARKNYTEQIGLITVAFYKSKISSVKPVQRAVGTGMGKAENINIGYFTGQEVPDELLAIYNFRYVTLETFRQLQRGK